MTRQHEFNYYLIGDRNWSGALGNVVDRKTHTANNLNQYTLF